MKTTIRQAAALLKLRSDYRIFFHEKPDGDAVGSACALALALRSVGKRCSVACSDPIPDIYAPLMARYSDDDVRDPVNISVDSAKLERLGRFSGERITLSIDHHDTNQMFAEHNCVDPEAAACAQIIYQLIIELGADITPLIADFLYTAIVTDTSCFRSRSVRPSTLRTAAELAERGADVVGIARRHYVYKTPARAEIERLICGSFKRTCGDQVLSAVITMADYAKTGITDSDLEGINELVEQFPETKLGIVVRELAPERCRFSVRAREGLDASAICKELGGGGHKTAAGGVMEADLESTLRSVEEACAKALGFSRLVN